MVSYEFYAKLRNQKGMKDVDVAKAAHISPSTFTDWKQGRSNPKEAKLRKIADAIGVSYFELIGASQDDVRVEISALNEELMLLKEYLSKLNDEGFEEAKKRIEELTLLPKYKKDGD